MSASEDGSGLDGPELYITPAQVFHGLERDFPRALMSDARKGYLQFSAVKATGRLVVAQLTTDRYYIFATPPDAPETKDDLIAMRQPAGSSHAIATIISNGEIIQKYTLVPKGKGHFIRYNKVDIIQPKLSDLLLSTIIDARILKPDAAESLDLLRSTSLRESDDYGQEYYADSSRTLGTISIEALEAYSLLWTGPEDAAESLSRIPPPM